MHCNNPFNPKSSSARAQVILYSELIEPYEMINEAGDEAMAALIAKKIWGLIIT